MVKLSFMLLFTGIIILSAGTGCSQDSTLKNEVKSIINLKPGYKSDTVLPDSLNLPLAGLNHTEGSVSSIEMTFLDTIEDTEYKLLIVLPACPKFSTRYKYKEGLEFNIDTFPYTIKGEDYRPYPNALYETEEKVKCYFTMNNTNTEEYNYVLFDLVELRIDEAFEENGKMTFRYTFTATSEFYDAVFSVDISDHEYGLMEVD
ncbi:MAG: hypothetical protein C0592_07610 [Marinilabiliales bacterium]|nr:MAG: hypothetical protein C0592_07610 [Marinilabiliales bacterium]